MSSLRHARIEIVHSIPPCCVLFSTDEQKSATVTHAKPVLLQTLKYSFVSASDYHVTACQCVAFAAVLRMAPKNGKIHPIVGGTTITARLVALSSHPMKSMRTSVMGEKRFFVTTLFVFPTRSTRHTVPFVQVY